MGRLGGVELKGGRVTKNMCFLVYCMLSGALCVWQGHEEGGQVKGEEPEGVAGAPLQAEG